jgi:hypothetical protein
LTWRHELALRHELACRHASQDPESIRDWLVKSHMRTARLIFLARLY